MAVSGPDEGELLKLRRGDVIVFDMQFADSQGEVVGMPAQVDALFVNIRQPWPMIYIIVCYVGEARQTRAVIYDPTRRRGVVKG